MKNTLLTVWFAMLLIGQIIAQPLQNKYSRVTIQAIEDQKAVEVRIANITDPCTITLTDIFGEVLIQDAYRSRIGYAKKFNLGNLPSGQFRMVVESESWICEQPVRIVGRSVSANSEQQSWYVLPEVQINKHTVKVLTSEELTIQPREIAIFNIDGEEIFAHNMRKRSSKRDIIFDISGLEPGTYNVKMYTGAKTIQKQFRKK